MENDCIYVQCNGMNVGAIIDRPAEKRCVFALTSGEYVTLYRAGDQ